MTNPFSNGKDRPRFTDPVDSERVKLYEHAQRFQYDARMERALELFENDRPAFMRLPNEIKSQVGIYADFRDDYRRAVTAGVIPDDRGPSAA
jgi:hypothetical protein